MGWSVKPEDVYREVKRSYPSLVYADKVRMVCQRSIVEFRGKEMCLLVDYVLKELGLGPCRCGSVLFGRGNWRIMGFLQGWGRVEGFQGGNWGVCVNALEGV